MTKGYHDISAEEEAKDYRPSFFAIEGEEQRKRQRHQS